MNAFDSVTPVAQSLVPPPKDERIGNVGSAVTGAREKYDMARAVIVGCPQDIGVRRNKGRPGASEAPDAIRRALYAFPAPEPVSSGAVYDLGDTRIGRSLEETHEIHRELVQTLLSDGKNVIVLGGGNDISYPDVAALAEVATDVLAFNIDSHFDVREADKPHSGTPYRQLLEERYLHPPHFYEMACKLVANAPVYEKYLQDKGVEIYSLERLRAEGMERVFEAILRSHRQSDAVFWGFDIDAVRTTDAPGVSASYPLGLTADEICRIATLAGDEPRTRMIELTEVNPSHDRDGRTAKLVAMMILYYLKGALQEGSRESESEKPAGNQ
jgi:formimidoylglutamase